MTPCVTVRIVAPARVGKSALRCGTIRIKIVRIPATRRGPDGSRNPARTTESRNFNVPVPALPAMARIGFARGFRWGANSRNARARLSDAIFQKLYSEVPIRGQSRTLAGGEGSAISPDAN